MTKDNVKNLEDIECPILNEDKMRENQNIIKGMGGNIADVKSPGLKVQILRVTSDYNQVYCPQLEDKKCKLTDKFCLYRF